MVLNVCAGKINPRPFNEFPIASCVDLPVLRDGVLNRCGTGDHARTCTVALRQSALVNNFPGVQSINELVHVRADSADLGSRPSSGSRDRGPSYHHSAHEPESLIAFATTGSAFPSPFRIAACPMRRLMQEHLLRQPGASPAHQQDAARRSHTTKDYCPSLTSEPPHR